MVQELARRSRHTAVLVLAACGLTGCDRAGDAIAEERGKPESAGSQSVELSANVPAATPPAAGCLSAPGGARDIIGIRVGMTADEAKAKLTCAGDGYQQSYKSWDYKPGEVQLRRNSMIAEADNDKIIVTLVGKPGTERVWAVHRTISFAKEAQPMAEDIRNQLAAQYGKLDFHVDNVRIDEPDRAVYKKVPDPKLPRIVRDASDRQIVYGAKQYEDCVSAIYIAYQIPLMTNATDCGFTVASKLVTESAHDDHVRSYNVLIGDPAQVIHFLSEDDPTIKPGCTMRGVCQMLQTTTDPRT